MAGPIRSDSHFAVAVGFEGMVEFSDGLDAGEAFSMPAEEIGAGAGALGSPEAIALFARAGLPDQNDGSAEELAHMEAVFFSSAMPKLHDVVALYDAEADQLAAEALAEVAAEAAEEAMEAQAAMAAAAEAEAAVADDEEVGSLLEADGMARTP